MMGAEVIPMIDPLRQLCEEAARMGASDVFLSEAQPARMRLHGKVSPIGDAPMKIDRRQLEELFQVCGVDFRTVHDRDAHWQTPCWRFRVNCHRHADGLGAVLRVIRTEIPTMKSLGLPEALLGSWLRRPFGLILVTGPTGCGKSTSVASMLDSLNHWRDAHGVTIEDPIEFLFQAKRCVFTQREIPNDVAGYTEGLRAALRQSPDIIFLGEIRDYESAKISLQAAETGHLVISTLHTSSVTETLERLANLFPGAVRRGVLSLLAAQLIGVITQKLLPAVDGGRHLVTEYFQNEGATRDWIMGMEYARLSDFIQSGSSGDNQGFLQALLQAWRDGHVAADVVLGATARPQELQRAMRGVSN